MKKKIPETTHENGHFSVYFCKINPIYGRTKDHSAIALRRLPSNEYIINFRSLIDRNLACVRSTLTSFFPFQASHSFASQLFHPISKVPDLNKTSRARNIRGITIPLNKFSRPKINFCLLKMVSKSFNAFSKPKTLIKNAFL